MNTILQLDIAGNPCAWMTNQQAISLIACDRVVANLGECEYVFRGGTNRYSGRRSKVVVSSILLTKERVLARRMSRDFEPPLTNRSLFARDQNLCLFCGNTFPTGQLTRDHVIPRSRNGSNSWGNSATCCRKCNHAKGNRTPEEWGKLLLAVPFTPNWAEYLYLKNSNRIIADQMIFLKERFSKNSPLLL